jgi:hypothetical protein
MPNWIERILFDANHDRVRKILPRNQQVEKKTRRRQTLAQD